MAAETHGGNLLGLVYGRLIEHREHLDSLFYGMLRSEKEEHICYVLGGFDKCFAVFYSAETIHPITAPLVGPSGCFSSTPQSARFRNRLCIDINKNLLATHVSPGGHSQQKYRE